MTDPIAVTRRAMLGAVGAASGWMWWRAVARAESVSQRLFVPGYRSDVAADGGRRVVDIPGVLRAPLGWDGPRTLLSVHDPDQPDAPLRRAAYPVRGHGLAFTPAGIGVFVGMDGGTVAGFDSDSLDLVALETPLHQGWLFGGHAALLPDGRHVAIPERAPPEPASGHLEADLARLGGRIVIRDATNLRPIESLPSYGLRPHDLAVTLDGRHLVVANYGSTNAADTGAAAPLPHVIAPCAAIIDLASGRLVERVSGPDPTAELRHLTAPRLDRIFAVTVRQGPVETVPEALRFPGAEPGLDYLPSRPLRIDGGRAFPLLGEHETVCLQGLSIGWDPAADQVLMAFPSSHTLVAFDGASGTPIALVRTDRHGVRWPCGVVLDPARERWSVTGHRDGILHVATGTFAVQAVDTRPAWWGHSHIVLH